MRDAPPAFLLFGRPLARLGVAASVLSLISCGDDAVTNPADVAAVVVTGVPVTPVVIGDSFQLVATAINGTGGIISNQAFVWRTSDPGVAAVSSRGLVRALGAGAVTIAGHLALSAQGYLFIAQQNGKLTAIAAR